MSEINKTLSKNINYYLNIQGLTYYDFALRMGIHTKLAIKIIYGEYKFELKTISKIESVLNVKLLSITV